MLPLPHVELPQQFLLFLPAIVTPLAGWLATDRLKPWVNALLVVLVVAACTGGAMLLSPQSLTGDLFYDFTILVAYVLAFVYGPLKPLLGYLSVKGSPLDIFAPAKMPATTLTTNGVVSNAASVTSTTPKITASTWQAGDISTRPTSVVPSVVPPRASATSRLTPLPSSPPQTSSQIDERHGG